MTTGADMVADARSHLNSRQRVGINILASTVTSGATSIAVTYALRGITRGAVISVDLERMYVVDDPADATKTATVIRGWDGTAAAAHTAGAVVRVNDETDDFTLLRAVNQDIADLSAPTNGLYRVRTVDLTYQPTTYGYDLASDMIGGPLLVQAEEPGGTGNWIRLDGWRFDANADATDFVSGKSLHLLEGGYPGRPLRVVYRAPFGQFTSLAQDAQTDIFLPSTANDIPPLGAAATLLAGRAASRSDMDSAGSNRRSEEVTVQDALISPRGLLARRDQRIAAEASRLVSLYGVAA